jgi:hypothetical protein
VDEGIGVGLGVVCGRLQAHTQIRRSGSGCRCRVLGRGRVQVWQAGAGSFL